MAVDNDNVNPGAADHSGAPSETLLTNSDLDESPSKRTDRSRVRRHAGAYVLQYHSM